MPKPKKPWYQGRWQQVRLRILDRDQHTCQIRGPRCTGTATHVDHIIRPEDGGEWWDAANLRAACPECNLGRKRRPAQHTGWQRSPTRITLVHGPPCAGKSSHVDAHHQPGELIIDYDRIAQALGSPDTHDHPDAIKTAAASVRGRLVDQLRRGRIDAARVWLVSANRRAPEIYPFHDLVRLDPGRAECLRRAEQLGRPAWAIESIEAFYGQAQAGAAGGSVAPSRAWL